MKLCTSCVLPLYPVHCQLCTWHIRIRLVLQERLLVDLNAQIILLSLHQWPLLYVDTPSAHLDWIQTLYVGEKKNYNIILGNDPYMNTNRQQITGLLSLSLMVTLLGTCLQPCLCAIKQWNTDTSQTSQVMLLKEQKVMACCTSGRREQKCDDVSVGADLRPSDLHRK